MMADGGRIANDKQKFGLKILKSLKGFNDGQTLNGVLELLGYSQYRFGKYATESQVNEVKNQLDILIKMGYVEESGIGYKITKEGSNFLNTFDYGSYEQGGYMAGGGKVKVGDTLTASTGVKVKVVEYDPMFGGRVKIERMDEYATGKPSQWMPLSKFKMADGGIMADKKFAVYAFDGKTNFFLDNEGNRSRVNYPSDIMSFDTTQEAIDFVKKHQYKYTYPLTWTTSPNLENTYSELNRDLEVYPISMMAEGGIISKTHKLG
jgi:hypothetical protein